jgi:hypothetical protein
VIRRVVVALGFFLLALGAVSCGGANERHVTIDSYGEALGQHLSGLENSVRVHVRMQELSETFARLPAAEAPKMADSTSKIQFSKADCKHLSPAQFEAYVDPRVTGKARALALLYMRAQPACSRQNVEGIDRVPYGNTWEGLREVQAEYDQWIRMPNGQYRDRDGDVITPTVPGPDS